MVVYQSLWGGRWGKDPIKSFFFFFFLKTSMRIPLFCIFCRNLIYSHVCNALFASFCWCTAFIIILLSSTFSLFLSTISICSLLGRRHSYRKFAHWFALFHETAFFLNLSCVWTFHNSKKYTPEAQYKKNNTIDCLKEISRRWERKRLMIFSKW